MTWGVRKASASTFIIQNAVIKWRAIDQSKQANWMYDFYTS